MESKSCRCDNDHITQVSVVILKYEALALCISHAPQRIDRRSLLMYGRWSSLFSCMLLLNHQSITEAGLFLDSQRLSILSACEGIVSVEVCFSNDTCQISCCKCYNTTQETLQYLCYWLMEIFVISVDLISVDLSVQI